MSVKSLAASTTDRAHRDLSIPAEKRSNLQRWRHTCRRPRATPRRWRERQRRARSTLTAWRPSRPPRSTIPSLADHTAQRATRFRRTHEQLQDEGFATARQLSRASGALPQQARATPRAAPATRAPRAPRHPLLRASDLAHAMHNLVAPANLADQKPLGPARLGGIATSSSS